MSREDLSKMSGETSFKRPRLIVLDEISLNGTQGKFFLTRFTQQKDATEKYAKEEIGSGPLSLVFMKVRRKLTEFDGDGLVRSTNEHTSPSDTVSLFAPGMGVEKGTAKALREKYKDMRTTQIVYAYDPVKKVSYKVNIKGMSLGSQDQPKGELSFYEYLSSFTEDEHFYEYITNLVVAQRPGKMGSPLFALHFVKGEALSDDVYAEVAEELKRIHNNITAVDAYYNESTPSSTVTVTNNKEMNLDEIEYPEDDLNPEDIPF